MEFRVLGSLEVLERGGRIPLGGPKQREVLAHLVLRANSVVAADSLIDDIWGDEPPDAARSALQAYVSRLRKALGTNRLEGRPPGYVLNAATDEVDALRFEHLVREARDRLAADPRTAADLFDRAFALWRGPPLADLADSLALRPEVSRLEELQLEALEARMEALLTLGRPADTALLEQLVHEHPLRERFWGQLMLALYRAGRQADALDAYRRARERLSEELGIDPSPQLQTLHERILRQDPELSPVGEPLRGYRLLEEVGDGPLGVVHRAVQPQLGREVAVKAIHRRYANDPEFIRRFEAEAQVVARLEHPRIVPVHDYWREPDGAYLVMRFLRGGSLREALDDGRLEPASIQRILDELAEALDAAHANGVVHGNVKPENVLFDERGNAYLTDFSIGTNGRAASASDVLAFARILEELVSSTTDGEHPTAEREVLRKATSNDAHLRYESAGAVAAAFLEALGAAPAPDIPVAVRNPYKGLRPFLESDAADFFGREAVTEQLVTAMSDRDARFLAVVGPSGCGKSSLVRAGLIPALHHGAVRGSERWFVCEMIPGARPFEELEDALLRVAVNPQANLLDDLVGDARGIHTAVRRVLPQEDAEILLVIDQFEELFTLVRDESTRNAFLAGLATCAREPTSRTRILVTLRADFYDRPLQYADFADLLATRSVVVTPPSTDELERAVSGPAEGVGVRLEPQLVAQVLTDVGDQPGALPLLQYALTELFEQRKDSMLTLDAYHRIGGVSGALARRAETIFEAQGPEGREAARQLFLRLITVGEEGAEDTRRRVLRTELTSLEVDASAMDAVIDAYGSRRLLSFDRDPITRGPTVEVSHEALLREWTRLRGWIDGAREDVRMHRRLDAAADEWVRSGEEQSFLLRGGRLAQFEAWAETTDVALTTLERRYLDSATAQREAETEMEHAREAREAALERRSIIRLRAMIAILTVAAVVASVLSVVAIGQRGRAQREARVATARELAAASNANLDNDPERSVLLALQAVATTRPDGTVLPEAAEALHDAVAADRQILTLRDPSTANVDWSPDGRLLATGGTAGGLEAHDVLIWNAITGAKLLTLKGHSKDVSNIAFSPDSTKLASAAEDRRTIVWNTRTGERLRTFSYPGEEMEGATFSPDGKLLGVSTTGGTRIVDVSTGRIVRTMPSSACGVPVFSPDGTQVAGGSGDVAVWNVRTGRQVLGTSVPDGSCGVVYSPDGDRLVSAAGPDVTVLDSHTGHQELSFPGQPQIWGLDWSRDGTRIATGSPDGTAIVWNAQTGQQELVLRGHASGVAQVAFSPDGTRLLTGGTDGTARVWDITPAGTAEAFGAWQDDEFTSVAYSPDGSRLVTTGSGPGQGGWLWDTSTGARIRGYPTAWSDVAFGANGSTVALKGDELTLRDTSTGRVLRTLSRPFLELQSGLAVSRDGSTLAAGVGPAEVKVWNARSGTPIYTFGGPLQGLYDYTQDVALSSDGKLVASLGNRGVLRVWNVHSHATLMQVIAHTGNGRAVAFSPDGSVVATSGEDGAALWSLPSGHKLATLASTGTVDSLAFSGDGRSLATGGEDGTARIWEVASGRLDLTLTGDRGAVTGVAFSPDGTRLATTGSDGTFRVYVLPIDQLVRIARQRLTRGLTPAECQQYLHVSSCPPSATVVAPAPARQAPARGGPEGAFHLDITPAELRSHGITRGEVRGDLAGDYTLSLAGGRWYLHQVHQQGAIWDESGPYTVDGRTITFHIVDVTRCFGGSWSAGWSLDRTSLTLAHISADLPAGCGRVFQEELQLRFGSNPWTRLF